MVLVVEFVGVLASASSSALFYLRRFHPSR
jgi:hypothetical protein